MAGSTVPTACVPSIGNLAAADLGQVTRAVKRKLKMLQYRPEVIDGCPAGTGLTLPAWSGCNSEGASALADAFPPSR